MLGTTVAIIFSAAWPLDINAELIESLAMLEFEMMIRNMASHTAQK
jgi:hypothetical protein